MQWFICMSHIWELDCDFGHATFGIKHNEKKIQWCQICDIDVFVSIYVNMFVVLLYFVISAHQRKWKTALWSQAIVSTLQVMCACVFMHIKRSFAKTDNPVCIYLFSYYYFIGTPQNSLTAVWLILIKCTIKKHDFFEIEILKKLKYFELKEY